jgi:hypothetical protein
MNTFLLRHEAIDRFAGSAKWQLGVSAYGHDQRQEIDRRQRQG